MDGVLHTEFLHVKPGKGAAFVRSKIKNLRTGNTVEKTFRAGEPLTAADVNKQQCQFTYTEVWNLELGLCKPVLLAYCPYDGSAMLS